MANWAPSQHEQTEVDDLSPLSVAGGILQNDRLSDLPMFEPTVQPAINCLQLTPIVHPLYKKPIETGFGLAPGKNTTTPLKRKWDLSESQTRQESKRQKVQGPQEQNNGGQKRKRVEVQETDNSLRKRARNDACGEDEQSFGVDDQPLQASCRSQSGKEQPKGGRPWRPTWWGPNPIEETAFYEFAGLTTVGDGKSFTYPCLVFSFQLFRAIWRALCARRQSQASTKWRDEEIWRLNSRINAIDAANTERVAQIDELRALEQGTTDWEDGEALWVAKQDLKNKVDESNEERAQLVEERESVQRKWFSTEDFALILQEPMFKQFDVLFEWLGVLPDFDNINEAPRVPVIEPEQRSRVSVEQPPIYPDRDSYGNSADPVDLLLQELSQRHDELLRMDAEFNRFRDGFDAELQKYIAQEKRDHPNSNLSTADLEQRFGPIWLSRHQEMTRNKAAVDDAYYQTDRMLMDAQRAAELASSHNHPNFHELDVPLWYPDADESIVSEFGRHISTRRQRRIEAWLNADEVRGPESAVPDSAIIQEDHAGDSWSVKSGESKASLAEGWLRRKIDDYERYVGRVQDGEAQDSNLFPQNLAESNHTES